MPVVIPPLHPPQASITWQPFVASREVAVAAALPVSTTQAASHWLFLAATLVIISSLVVAVRHCSRRRDTWDPRTRSCPREEQAETRAEKHAARDRRHNIAVLPEPKREFGQESESTRIQSEPARQSRAQQSFHFRAGYSPGRWAPDLSHTMGGSPRTPTTNSELLSTSLTDHTASLAADLASGTSSDCLKKLAVSSVLPPPLPSFFPAVGVHSNETTPSTNRHELPAMPPPPLPTSTSGFVFSAGLGSSEYIAAFAPLTSEQVDAQISFIHQPNPDYTSGVSLDLNLDPDLKADQDSKTTPLLRLPQPPPPSTILIARHRTIGGGTSDEPVLDVASATSVSQPCPPFLPPSADAAAAVVRSPGEGDVTRDISVRGEIISVLDDSGAGWTRHTRVYGGGVCLACLAADSGGGTYGDSVPMEDRR